MPTCACKSVYGGLFSPGFRILIKPGLINQQITVSYTGDLYLLVIRAIGRSTGAQHHVSRLTFSLLYQSFTSLFRECFGNTNNIKQWNFGSWCRQSIIPTTGLHHFNRVIRRASYDDYNCPHHLLRLLVVEMLATLLVSLKWNFGSWSP